MNFATVIVLLIVAVLVIVAIRIMRSSKGTCSCNDNKKSSCSNCSVDCPFKK